ncbi:hypothetical protein D3C85_537010 [compost metagenome]
MFQHMAQMPGTFPGSHGGAEQLRERLGKLRQCRGESMPFHHPASDRRQQARDPPFGTLFCHRIKRLLQRQTGLHQCRQLQRQQRQIGGAQPSGAPWCIHAIRDLDRTHAARPKAAFTQ